MKRQHLLLVGLLLFFAGVQLRLVDSFTLNEKSSRFIAAQVVRGSPVQQQMMWASGSGRKVVQPPRWLGLALMSVGSVMALKGISVRKPAPAA